MMEKLKGNQHKFYLSPSISINISNQLKEQLKRGGHIQVNNQTQSNLFYVLETFDNVILINFKLFLLLFFQFFKHFLFIDFHEHFDVVFIFLLFF
jgi:hypothetical protein